MHATTLSLFFLSFALLTQAAVSVCGGNFTINSNEDFQSTLGCTTFGSLSVGPGVTAPLKFPNLLWVNGAITFTGTQSPSASFPSLQRASLFVLSSTLLTTLSFPSNTSTTIDGNVLIRNNLKLTRLDGNFDVIGGQLFITANSAPLSVDLSTGSVGQVLVDANPGLTFFRLSNVSQIPGLTTGEPGLFKVSNSNQLNSISVLAAASSQGTLCNGQVIVQFTGVSSLRLEFSSATSILLTDNVSLGPWALEFSSLSYVKTFVQVVNNAGLASVHFPLIGSVMTNFQISGVNITSIVAPSPFSANQVIINVGSPAKLANVTLGVNQVKGIVSVSDSYLDVLYFIRLVQAISPGGADAVSISRNVVRKIIVDGPHASLIVGNLVVSGNSGLDEVFFRTSFITGYFIFEGNVGGNTGYTFTSYTLAILSNLVFANNKNLRDTSFVNIANLGGFFNAPAMTETTITVAGNEFQDGSTFMIGGGFAARSGVSITANTGNVKYWMPGLLRVGGDLNIIANSGAPLFNISLLRCAKNVRFVSSSASQVMFNTVVNITSSLSLEQKSKAVWADPVSGKIGLLIGATCVSCSNTSSCSPGNPNLKAALCSPACNYGPFVPAVGLNNWLFPWPTFPTGAAAPNATALSFKSPTRSVASKVTTKTNAPVGLVNSSASAVMLPLLLALLAAMFC